MNSTHHRNLYSEADQLLRAANAEMNRAAEDAVTHLICHHSRQSIINYLKGFLLGKTIKPAEPVTMASLLAQCAEVD